MFEEPAYLLQTAFARGEVSPAMFGRTDLAGYLQGLRTLRNYTVRPEGAVSNRQGFNYTGNALTNATKASLLIPFIFSATQSYVLEVGAGTAQVFALGALVNGAATSTITNAQLVFSLHPPGYVVQITTNIPHLLSANQNCNISGTTGTGSFAMNGSHTVVNVISATVFQIWAPAGNTGAFSGAGIVTAPLNFSTPWAAADLPLLRWAQSTDTLTLVHPLYPPYEIKRTSANAFTCTPAVYINGPFLPQNTDGTTFVAASALTGAITLTASANIFNVNHVGALFQLTQQDLSNIQPWEPTKQFPNSTIVGQYRRASLKNYKALSLVTASPGAQNATGTFIPSHSQGTQADGDGNIIVGVGSAGVNWQYQDSGFGTVLITGFTDAKHVTGTVQPNYTGGPGLLPTSVVGGPAPVVGPFTFTGTGAATSFGPLTGNTSTDPSKYFVTVSGVYVSPSAYSISATGGGNIVFLAPPAVGGANNISVTQITTLGQTTFWAFGAFSKDQGYPSAVSYFPDRLILASTPQQPVGVFGSKTSLYHDFGVSNPIVASDAFTVFLNARQLNAISDLIPLSDLLVGTSNINWRLWPGSTGVALSPLAIAATPQSYYGQSPSCASVLFGDSAIFPEYDGRRLRDLVYQFAYDKFLGQELTLYSRHLIPFGTQFQRLSYKPDPTGQLVVGLRNDGLLLICTYLRDQQVIGWARWDTQGTFEDQVVVPENTSFGVYAITSRVVNGATVRYVEHLSNREVSTIYDYQFLDCSSTYDGRNTSSTTMLVSALSALTAGSTGTITASSATGWATFLASDAANKNEIWVFQTLAFQTSIAGQTSGVLITATVPGTYIVTFSDGEARSVTIAADGLSCSWQEPLGSGGILSGVIRCRCQITAVAGALQASITLRDPMPPGLYGVTTAVWTFARTAFSGANQIAGLKAVALVDATVFGINSNASVPNGLLSIGADGTFTLPSAGGVVQVGLPYLCDFETLPLNDPGQVIRERAKGIPIIYLDVTETRNFLAGGDFSTANQYPNVERAFEPYTSAIAMQSGILYTRMNVDLDTEAHVCIRQNMPLPITIRMQITGVNIGEVAG